MCGLTGLVHRGASAEGLESEIRAMTRVIAHRGPDDEGFWVDAEHGVALGHRRLSIVDLSPEGHQPMRSESGRYVMVFNGEVYNYEDLRKELLPAGHAFRGHSDTEVMLAAFEEWGIAKSVERFNGFFAFAVWDRKEHKLHLVRDRLGIKPLYYGWNGGTLAFGSELKSIRALFSGALEMDRESLAVFLRHSCIPAPFSIYKGIYKLPQGAMLTLSGTELASRPAGFSPDPADAAAACRPVTYWSAAEHAVRGMRDPFDGSFEEATEKLHELLMDSIRIRMVADVPLGAFLSGGIDSSTVVALMQSQSSRPVRTFSIGFHESQYNEAA
jgi:asparagine synthase (glutamine-hydrolysing)